MLLTLLEEPWEHTAYQHWSEKCLQNGTIPKVNKAHSTKYVFKMHYRPFIGFSATFKP